MKEIKVRETSTYPAVIWSGSLVEAAEICHWINSNPMLHAVATYNERYNQITVQPKEWDEYSCWLHLNPGDGVRHADNAHDPQVSAIYAEATNWEEVK